MFYFINKKNLTVVVILLKTRTICKKKRLQDFANNGTKLVKYLADSKHFENYHHGLKILPNHKSVFHK